LATGILIASGKVSSSFTCKKLFPYAAVPDSQVPRRDFPLQIMTHVIFGKISNRVAWKTGWLEFLRNFHGSSGRASTSIPSSVEYKGLPFGSCTPLPLLNQPISSRTLPRFLCEWIDSIPVHVKFINEIPRLPLNWITHNDEIEIENYLAHGSLLGQTHLSCKRRTRQVAHGGVYNSECTCLFSGSCKGRMPRRRGYQVSVWACDMWRSLPPSGPDIKFTCDS
jgi:hypothetical protein